MINIKAVNNQEEFLALKNDWQTILVSAESQSVFSTWEWNYSWWQAFGGKYELFFITVFEDDELVGIAPLYQEKIHFLFSLKRLRFISDRNNIARELGLITKKGREEKVLKEIFGFLNKTAWDQWYWFGVLESQAAYKQIKESAENKQFFLREMKGKYSTVELRGWEGYLKTLRPRQRSKVRALLKNFDDLRQSGAVELIISEKGAEINEQLDSFISLHQKRWNKKNKPGMFGEEGYNHFLGDLAPKLLEKNELFFCHLKYEGKYIAHQFCLKKNNVIHLINEAYDEEFEKFSAGNMLRSAVFRQLCETGATYDFLNNYSFHKKSWGAVPARQYNLEIGRKNLKNRIYFGYYNLRGLIIGLAPKQIVEMKGRIQCRIQEVLKYLRYKFQK